MELSRIEANYAQMSDEQIVRIATTEAYGLRPEVFGILEHEIRKRNLNPDILKGAIAQNRTYTIEELEQYAEILRDLRCPSCGNPRKKLNGTTTYIVRSFIILTQTHQETYVACPDCLDSKNNNAIAETFGLGWWGFWGLFYTPLYLYRNYKTKQENRMSVPNSALLAFTLANIGAIETYKEQEEELFEVIKPKRY